MVAMGVLHFVRPEGFASIVPAILPHPLALVEISGFFEVLGGLGLLVPFAQRAAAVGLCALYVSVFPANINMAVHHLGVPPGPGWSALLWARLPLQFGLIALGIWLSRPPLQARAAKKAPSR